MKEQEVAKSYARALINLGEESSVDIASEFVKLNEVINSSNDLENVLFLDIFTIEEKTDVFLKVSEKLNLSAPIKNAVMFLINEKRMNVFPLIFKEVVVIDDHKRGFLKGIIEGSEDQVNEEHVNSLKKILKEKLNTEINLEYKKSNDLTAGYRVTVDDFQVDASIDNQFDIFKSSILGER